VDIRGGGMRTSIIEKIMVLARSPFRSSRLKIIRSIRNVQKIQFLLLTD